MFNIWFIFVYVVVASVLNLILPIYKGIHGYKSGFQWILVLVYIYGYFYQSGRLLGQKVPIIQIAICRIMELVVHTLFLKSQSINWPMFIALLIIDFIYLALLMFDKLNYEYIEEEVW